MKIMKSMKQWVLVALFALGAQHVVANSSEQAELEALMRGESIENQEITPDALDLTQINEETRNFWENLQPLEDKQDLNTFKQITLDMCNKTQVPIQLVSLTQPKEIPFEELSSYQAGEAAKGSKFYQGAKAKFRVNPAYLVFCNDVMVPKIEDFFEPLAKEVTRKTITCTVKGKMDFEFSHELNNFPILKEHLNIRVCRIKDIAAAFAAAPGTQVEAELVVYHLPQIYTDCYYRIAACYTGGIMGIKECNTYDRSVFVHAQDIAEKHIWSSTPTHIKAPLMWYEGPISWSTGSGSFTVPSDRAFDKCIANFKRDVDTYPYLLAERAAANNDADFLLYIFLPIVLLWMVLGGYILYVVFWVERKRRWVALPAAAGYEEQLVANLENLREEFRPVMEWFGALPSVTNEDGSVGTLFSEKKQVDEGYAHIHALRNLPDLNGDEIIILNAMGADLNEVSARVCCISKTAITLIMSIFGLLFLNSVVSSGGFWSCLWNILLLGSYGLALFYSFKCPLYKFGNDEPGWVAGLRKMVTGIGIGSFLFACDVGSGKYQTVYLDKYGNRYKDTEETTYGCIFAAIIAMIIISLIPFWIMLYSTVYGVRNYLSNK